MTSYDKTRNRTINPNEDHMALGENPNLRPMDRVRVKAAFSFMDGDSLRDRDRAARFLLDRIADYYEVIGYAPPHVNSYSEVGITLGGWNQDRGFTPWRSEIYTSNSTAWANPERIFNDTRYASFEAALFLAAWEVTQEVPESKYALRKAAYLATQTIKDLCEEDWSSIRRRYGSKKMRNVLNQVRAKLDQYELVKGRYWLGTFAERSCHTESRAA